LKQINYGTSLAKLQHQVGDSQLQILAVAAGEKRLADFQREIVHSEIELHSSESCARGTGGASNRLSLVERADLGRMSIAGRTVAG
jgi:hypothetical protein